jgi:hypothetical protein
VGKIHALVRFVLCLSRGVIQAGKGPVALALLLAALMFLVGCSTDAKNVSSENGVVYISPSTLFKGDTKILQPHLGIIGGCVEVKYKGTKKFIRVSSELWENGEQKSTVGVLDSKIDGSFNGDVSVSLRDEGSDNPSHSFKDVLEISQNGGYASLTGIVPGFSSQYGSGPKELSGMIKVNDNQKIAVWGLMAEKTPNISFANNESVEEMARKVDWAFVLKISFLDKEPSSPQSTNNKQS